MTEVRRGNFHAEFEPTTADDRLFGGFRLAADDRNRIRPHARRALLSDRRSATATYHLHK